MIKKVLNSIVSLFIIFMGVATHLSAGEYDAYLELIQKHESTAGPIGDFQNGEIELVLEPKKMKEIEQLTGRKVGIVDKDPYFIWLNDAVRFPSGKYGVYGRILWEKSLQGPPGVAVLPVLADQTIALIRTYRHATRSWEYELPRGGVELGEKLVDVAKRELLEETGLLASELKLLGKFYPDSGMTNTLAFVYLARVDGKGERTPEESEVIEHLDFFNLSELKEGIVNGYLTRRRTKTSFKDPFLCFALFQGILQGQID